MGEGIAVDTHNRQLDETGPSALMRDFNSKGTGYSALARPQILGKILLLKQTKFYMLLVLHTCESIG